jgi:hypothetical protein
MALVAENCRAWLSIEVAIDNLRGRRGCDSVWRCVANRYARTLMIRALSGERITRRCKGERYQTIDDVNALWSFRATH